MFQLNRWNLPERGYHGGVLHGGSDRLADLGPYQWPGTRTHLHHALAGTRHDTSTSLVSTEQCQGRSPYL